MSQTDRNIRNSQTPLQLLQDAINSLPDCITILDENETVIFANQACTRYPAICTNMMDMDSEQAQAAAQSIREVLRAERTEFAMEYCHPEDNTWYLMRATRFTSGEQPYVIVTHEDISKQKRTEEALSQERNLLLTLIDNLPDLIYVKDTRSRFVLANRATLKQAGLQKPEHIIGKTDFDFSLPKDLAVQYYTVEQKIIQSGEPVYHKNEKTIDSSGAVRDVLTTKIPLRDDQGNITGIVGISRDITALKRTEEALRASEHKYRQLIEQIPAIIYITHPDVSSKNVYISPQVEPILGITPEEWLSNPAVWQNMLHPDDHDQVLAQVENCRTSGVFAAEYRLLDRKGQVHWFRDEAMIIRDETGEPLMQGIMIEITERKHAEKAQRLSEARYRIVSDLIFDFAYAIHMEPDGEMAFDWVTGAFTAITGYTEEDIKYHYDWQQFIHPDDIAILQQRTQKMPIGQNIVSEFRILTKQGEVRWVRDHSRLEWDSEANQLRIYAAVQDITERKHAEEARERIIEELNLFAQTVAHDLKSPLSAIIGFAEVLDVTFPVLTPTQMKRRIHAIMQAGEKMRVLIDELLLLASVRERDEVPVEPLDMMQIIAAVQQRLDHMIEVSEAEILLDGLPHDWPTAQGYAPWIEEVWANYISNAIKYGGSESSAPYIEVGAVRAPNNMVRFWVRDNGQGIAPEDQGKLFNAFSRLNNTKTGHGLGLSIVQRIVERFGGEVTVESKLGEGSTFSFTLPAALHS